MTSFETIRYEVDNRVGVLTLDRPERMNALSARLLDELGTVLDQAAVDSVGAIVISGGPKFFSVGADLGEASGRLDQSTPLTTAKSSHRTMAIFDAIARHPKPVIAAMAGLALGGGAELALACDLRMAAADASIGFPEVKLGVLPAAGGTQRLSRLIGQTKALELLLTGNRLSAAEAERLGLVNAVVPAAELLERTLELAAKLAGGAPLAVAAIKQVVRAGLDASLHAGLELEAQAAALLMSTADAAEGIRAFVEKRPPKFAGK